jgi:hypothetical protein
MGEVDQPFKIFEGYPRLEIPQSCHNMLDDAPVVNGCLMNIEYVDGPHPLDILQAAQSEKKERSEMDNLQEVAEERDKFMTSVCSPSGAIRNIDRANVFSNVLQLFSSEEVTKEYPLCVRFHGELAIDTGGVFREMISAFWEIA